MNNEAFVTIYNLIAWTNWTNITYWHNIMYPISSKERVEYHLEEFNSAMVTFWRDKMDNHQLTVVEAFP